MLRDLNVFTGDITTRKFRFVPGTMSTHKSWATLSMSDQMGRFVTNIHRSGTSEECIRGRGPYLEFQLTGMGKVASTGIPNIDHFIYHDLGHWRELDQLIGKIHIARGGSWHADRDTRAITIRGACLAFTHRKKSFEPSPYKIERPRPWGLEAIIVREGKIMINP